MGKRGFEDYEIKSKVRSFLVKLMLDTATLNIGVHRGHVTILGNLKDSSSVMSFQIARRIEEDPFMESFERSDIVPDKNIPMKRNISSSTDSIGRKIILLETSINEISGVRSLVMDFRNYKKSGEIWKRKQ